MTSEIHRLEEFLTPIPKDLWIESDSIKACMVCNEVFGLFRTKRHCRACGQVVCLKCSNHKISQQRICDPCFIGIEVKNAKAYETSVALPELPTWMENTSNKAAFKKTQTSFKDAADMTRMISSRLHSENFSSLASSALLQDGDEIEHQEDLVAHGRVVTSVNIKYKEMTRARGRINRNIEIQKTETPPIIQDNANDRDILLCENDGDKLLLLLGVDDEADGLNYNQFETFVKDIKRNTTELNIRRLFQYLSEDTEFISPERIQMFLEAKWGRWVADFQKRLKQYLLKRTSEAIEGDLEMMGPSNSYLHSIKKRSPNKNKNRQTLSPLVSDMLEDIRSENVSDEEKKAQLEATLQGADLGEDLGLILIRHNWSVNKFSSIPDWEILEEDLLTPAAKINLKQKKGAPGGLKRMQTRFQTVEIDEKVTESGWLWKQGGVNKYWRRRYFEMFGTRSMVYKVSDGKKEKISGNVDLTTVSSIESVNMDEVSGPDEIKFGFRVTSSQRIWMFGAEHIADVLKWQTAIQNATGCEVIGEGTN